MYLSSQFIYSIDATSDKNKTTEKEYFDKVKSVMSKDAKNPDSIAKTRAGRNIGVFSYIKVIIVLVVIIGIIYLISQFIRKYMNVKTEIGEGTNVISSHAIGAGKWIQVVYVTGKFLILGVTNDNITLLSEVKDPKEIERLEVLMNEKKTEEGYNFVDVVSSFLKDKFNTTFKKEKFNYETDSIDFLSKQKERLKRLNNKDEK